jgi:hypothetical protein
LGTPAETYEQLNTVVDVKKHVVNHFDIASEAQSCSAKLADELRCLHTSQGNTNTDATTEYPVFDILESIASSSDLSAELMPNSVELLPVYLPLEPLLLSRAFSTPTFSLHASSSAPPPTVATPEVSSYSSSGKRLHCDSPILPSAKRSRVAQGSSLPLLPSAPALPKPTGSGTPAENKAGRRRWNQQKKRARLQQQSTPSHVRLQKHLTRIKPIKQIAEFNP